MPTCRHRAASGGEVKSIQSHLMCRAPVHHLTSGYIGLCLPLLWTGSSPVLSVCIQYCSHHYINCHGLVFWSVIYHFSVNSRSVHMKHKLYALPSLKYHYTTKPKLRIHM